MIDKEMYDWWMGYPDLDFILEKVQKKLAQNGPNETMQKVADDIKAMNQQKYDNQLTYYKKNGLSSEFWRNHDKGRLELLPGVKEELFEYFNINQRKEK